MVTLRKADPSDAEAIARVHVTSWRETYAGIVPQDHLDSLDVGARTERWREILQSPHSTTFVAEDEGKVVGFVSGGAMRPPVANYDGGILALYLLQSHQRQRAGSQMVQQIAQHLCAQGFRRLAVWVLAENPACRFYRRMGGIQLLEQTIEIGGQALPEVAFGWPDISMLAAARGAENGG